MEFQLPSLDHKFDLADVTTPILGLDFLSHPDLAIDCRRGRVFPTQSIASDQRTPRDKQARSVREPSLSILSLSTPDQLRVLMKQYGKLFGPFSNETSVKHPIEHQIVTDGHPCWSHHRRMCGDKLDRAREAFRELEAKGVVYRGKSLKTGWKFGARLATSGI